MSSPTPSHSGPSPHGTDRLSRAPPQRVMEERAQRDLAYEARRLEAEIKHVGKLTFEINKQRDEEKAAAAFAQEDKQRKLVSVDAASTEVLRRLGVSTQDDVRPVQWMDWKSPMRGSAKVERLDTTATNAFLKSIGVYEHNRLGRPHAETGHESPPPVDNGDHQRHSSHRTPPRQPRETSVASTHMEPKPAPLPAKLSGRDAPVKTRSYEKQEVDYSRAPSRTLVSRIPALVALSKTKPLAPIPQQPKLASTVVPERGSLVNTEKMLSAFKMQQIEEREFNVDLRSRKMAEEQDGTLLHFEMTSSIKRVEGILSALERGKEYRDMVAYKDKHDEREQLESSHKSSSHDDTTLDELRQVIQILLKDSAHQGQQMQELDQQFRKASGDLQYVTGELGKKQARIETLQEQLDGLVSEREVLKKEKAHLETRVEQLVESTKALVRAAEERRASFRGSSGVDDSGTSAPREGHPDGSQPPSRSAARKPLDAAAMLKELAPTLPSLDSVPKGDDVTIVCTAVQSISRLWEQFASDMPTALSLHNRIILEEIPKHRGYQVKTAGEEFLVAFHTTNQAVNFAMAVQEQLVQQVWPQKLSADPSCAVVPNEAPLDGSDMPLPTGDLWRGLRVAMGIHYGPVHVEFNPVTNGFDYMGSTVNRALLLKRISQGGMAAVSKEVYDRLTKEMDAIDSEQQKQQGTGQMPGQNVPPPSADASLVPAHSISYAETLRKRSSARSLKALLSSDKGGSSTVSTALHPITTAFHCKIPAARSAASDVYCVLPASLEGRLVDIQSTNRQKAEAHGLPMDALQPRMDDEVPSELEAMLGTFARRGQKALFLTGEGVEDAAELLNEDEEAEIAIMHAGLPTGVVCLLSIQCDATRNKRFTEKILAKDMENLIKIFHDSIEMASAPFGAKVVDWRGDIHTLAFGNIGVAVRCALAIDDELTTAAWPKLIDTYKETEEVVWYGQVRIFAGLRASMGIHVAQMKPHYDPMTKTVGYIGFDSFVAYRLACVAAPGQILLEETTAYAALAVVNPMPLYTHLVPNASGSSTVASRLCIVTSRLYVGRHFVWAGMEQYQLCHTPQFADQYRRMKSDLEIEDIRWKRDATRVVAKEQMSAGITAKTSTAPSEDAKKSTEQGEGAEQEGGDAEGLLGAGLGQKLEAAMAKASGTVTHAMEMRLRDLEVTQILLSTLREKLDSENISELLRDREPIINQMEKLEHNLMVLNDAYLEGQLVAFQPLIADITDLRELPLKGTSRDAPSATTGGEAPSTGRRRNADDSAWTDVDDDDEDDTKPAEEDEDLEAMASLAVADSRGVYGRLSAQGDGNQTAAEEELKKRLVVLEEEVLLAHRICRNMFAVLKEWMEPLLSSNARYIMPDEEVVSKLISADRTAREPYLKKKAVPAAEKPQTNVVSSIPKTTRQLWRQIIEHAVVDQDVEERMRGKGSKLLKSLESQVCRHFLFLRQYVKRVRVKEKYGSSR